VRYTHWLKTVVNEIKGKMIKTKALVLAICVLFLAATSAATGPLSSPEGWSEDIRLTTDSASSTNPAIAVDTTSNVHITWENYMQENTEIYYTKLDNSGNTLVDDTRLTTASSWWWHPEIEVDTNNNVHITWFDDRDGNWEIYYTKLDNNGNTLVDDTRLTTNSAKSWLPTIAVDTTNNVHITWEDYRDVHVEIYYTKLDNNGNTLVDDTRLTTDTTCWSSDPAIAVDTTNNVHITWMDSRDGNWEIYYKNNCGGASANQQPIANAGGPYSANINEPIQLHGSGTDPDGDVIIAYAWDFNNDGTTDSGLQNPTHSWSLAGTYYPTLKVKDERGAWSKPNGCDVHVFEPFTFIQVTDTHCGAGDAEERLADAIREINEINPDFILVTGDIVETATLTDPLLLDRPTWYPGYYEDFLSAVSGLNPDIKVYVVPGNHDRYRKLYLIPWSYSNTNLTYFNLHINPTRPIDCNDLIPPNNYTFEHKGYRFIGLDSGEDIFYDATPIGSGLTLAQISALKSLSTDQPKIIFMHHPALNDEDDPKWEDYPAYVPWGGDNACIGYYRLDFINYCATPENSVQLVLTGHTHKSLLIYRYDNTFYGQEDIYLTHSYDWFEDQYPFFIQTPSVGKDNGEFKHGYRIIDVKNGRAMPRAYTKTDRHLSYSVELHSPADLHVYDSEGRHTGMNTSTGEVERNIPDSFYFGRYNLSDQNESEMILLYNTSESYRFEIISNLTKESQEAGIMSSPLTGSFNFTLEKQTDDSITTISYDNVSIQENTTASVSVDPIHPVEALRNIITASSTYTMDIDYDGNGVTDESKDPDAITTDYVPTAQIISPLNNSIHLYGNGIAFNGTGTDVEDGILTNSSLVWTSSSDGVIGIGNEFNTTTNLSAGIHLIELMVNDSIGQIGTDNVTITVLAPDLAITTSDISFSSPYPVEGEDITINATIHNIGTANASNVTVQFFDGEPINGTQIGENQTIASLNARENKTVSLSWDTTGEAGDNCIWVVIDPYNTLKESDEGNNQANKSLFVSAPNYLHILQAQTDSAVYVENEAVMISCIVQNASSNISADVSAAIENPDGFRDNMTLIEGLIGNYYGTFTNTSLSGTYTIMIYANQTGFIGDTDSLSFTVLDTTPPASITNITHSNSTTWINWTWDNPNDPDFGYTLIYLNRTWKAATSKNYYLAEGLNASAVYELETRTVDMKGNINEMWVNQTAKTSGEEPPLNFFDTGTSVIPYPSIAGTHNGTISPLKDIVNLTTLYTYPCAGTGGQTEYARIYNVSGTLAEAQWNGYVGDWHNITFNQPFILRENETYYYTIRTGSYPQIIHESPFNATGGVITCTNFTDANGKKYYNWIPAIRLE
jgi:hypothetical protein